MNIRVMAALAVMAGQGAQAEEAYSLKQVMGDIRVIVAIKTAWAGAKNGTKGIEASFRLDGTPENYEVVNLPCSNEMMNQKIKVIPGRTFAVFHVHPSEGDPAPSRQDRLVADKYHMKIVTIHYKGLFEYDPVTKKITQLGERLEWTKALKGRGDLVSGL